MNLLTVFALGNLIPALLLGLGCYALPLRWWVMDVPVSLVVAGLVTSSALSFAKPALAPRVLRIAAFSLLALGLALVAAFGLSVAFLSGVNGPFGAFGMILMGLVVMMVAPYAVVYPAAQLWWLGRRGGGAARELAGHERQAATETGAGSSERS